MGAGDHTPSRLSTKAAALKIADSSFFDSVRGSRRILFLSLGGLGDVVHSVPALRSIRLSFPNSRIDVLVSAGATDFLRGIVPVDHIIPYSGRQAGWSWADLRQLWQLFSSRYDLCVNFWGSNHASAIALSTLAPGRLGRVPSEPWKRAWRFCHTQVSDYPHMREPLHRQWTNILGQLGFRVDPEFSIANDPQGFIDTGLDPGLRGRYIHISPSASHPAKDVSLPVLVEAVAGISHRLPQYPLVISTTALPRHQQRLQAVLAALERPPAAVFSGSIDTAALFRLIQNAALHVSADSGPIHMAVAAGTPSVSWFLHNDYVLEYLPTGERHAAFVVEKISEEGIESIAPSSIVERCVDLLGRFGPATAADISAQSVSAPAPG